MSDEFKDMPLDKLIELWRKYDTVVPKEEILRVLKLRDQLLDALQAKNKKAFSRWMSEGDDPERHYKGTEIIAQYRNNIKRGSRLAPPN